MSYIKYSHGSFEIAQETQIDVDAGDLLSEMEPEDVVDFFDNDALLTEMSDETILNYANRNISIDDRFNSLSDDDKGAFVSMAGDEAQAKLDAIKVHLAPHPTVAGVESIVKVLAEVGSSAEIIGITMFDPNGGDNRRTTKLNAMEGTFTTSNEAAFWAIVNMVAKS